jgi:small subunit ribosomal protein S9
MEKTTKKIKKEKPKKIKQVFISSRNKEQEVKKEPQLTSKPEKYLEAVGRRKTAIARVRLLIKGEKSFLINGKPLAHYLPGFELQKIANSPLEKMNCLDKFGILAKVKGGGIHAQAEAIRLGIARALIIFNPDFRKRLKRVNYLTRDPRMKERKKFGLKRARRAPQWQKR